MALHGSQSQPAALPTRRAYRKFAVSSRFSAATFLNSGTELTYCALSLTSKLWLGWFILLNVLYNKPEDGGADAALRGANAGDS